ncbi:MAG: 2-amino-4-hydroxy-6-hydroxymethyldihydropteridine diphosphokinase [Acidobacteriaceae bacterium]
MPRTNISRTATAYIALGSNLGNRGEHLLSAVDALHTLGTVRAVSSFYETAPVGTIAQPDFLNAVAELQTELAPLTLLASLLQIEQQHGRDRDASPPKGPRTLDLDLLACDDLVLETPTLTLPHPALAERQFVLVPLAEIAPGWRHPLLARTAAQLLRTLLQTAGSNPAAVRKFLRPM